MIKSFWVNDDLRFSTSENIFKCWVTKGRSLSTGSMGCKEMTKSLRTASTALYPHPVVLVTCSDGKSDDIVTLAWAGTICSDPPMLSVSIRPSRFSHKLISESKEFIVNVPTEKILKEVDFCGMHSGKDTDKWKKTGLTKLPARDVSAPMIAECPINIECKVKEVKQLGTHDMFLAEVIHVHADKDVKSKGRTKPVVYIDGEYWGLSEEVGVHGYSEH
jgi:flavin reductase (DIM6/NTAB) family NADH-FMN oxidoreductase RutF